MERSHTQSEGSLSSPKPTYDYCISRAKHGIPPMERPHTQSESSLSPPKPTYDYHISRATLPAGQYCSMQCLPLSKTADVFVSQEPALRKQTFWHCASQLRKNFLVNLRIISLSLASEVSVISNRILSSTYGAQPTRMLISWVFWVYWVFQTNNW